jgi:enoyl-CoA hydratase/carnithine racemase
MKTFENILVTKNYRDHQHVALIQLNRPKVLNALSTDLMREVVEALFLLEDDRDVRVIILTGNDRAFAAGADIKEMASKTFIGATCPRAASASASRASSAATVALCSASAAPSRASSAPTAAARCAISFCCSHKEKKNALLLALPISALL